MAANTDLGSALNEAVDKLIEKAVMEIERRGADTVFVLGKRAQGKRKRLAPTDSQSRLYRWIKQHQPISFEESLGMDWRFLGGLFTRGKVEWRRGKLYTQE